MPIHIGRSVFGWGGITLMFAAVAFIPLSDATAISFFNPVVGVFMAIAQTCFINAMARADGSFVTPFSYVTLIFASLYDLFFFNIWPDAVSCIGASMIVAGAVLLARREGRAQALSR